MHSKITVVVVDIGSRSIFLIFAYCNKFGTVCTLSGKLGFLRLADAKTITRIERSSPKKTSRSEQHNLVIFDSFN